METRGPDISRQGQAVIKIVAQIHYNTSTTTEGEKKFLRKCLEIFNSRILSL